MVVWLSVSGKAVDPNCDVVVTAMQELGILGDITRNTTVSYEGQTENGCRVLILGGDARSNAHSLWKKLHDKVPSLCCAHLNVEHRESGCVFDVFAPSRCPTAVP